MLQVVQMLSPLLAQTWALCVNCCHELTSFREAGHRLLSKSSMTHQTPAPPSSSCKKLGVDNGFSHHRHKVAGGS